MHSHRRRSCPLRLQPVTRCIRKLRPEVFPYVRQLKDYISNVFGRVKGCFCVLAQSTPFSPVRVWQRVALEGAGERVHPELGPVLCSSFRCCPPNTSLVGGGPPNQRPDRLVAGPKPAWLPGASWAFCSACGDRSGRAGDPCAPLAPPLPPTETAKKGCPACSCSQKLTTLLRHSPLACGVCDNEML